MTGVRHALCNAHQLRELKALVEIEKEDRARRMRRLLRRACHATNLARDRGVPLKPSLIARIERCYDAILAEGLAFHAAQPALVSAAVAARRHGRPARRVGHNLLLRLSTRKRDCCGSAPASGTAAAQHPQAGRAPLPHRSEGAFHQQSGGARRADDEAAAEDLRRLPLRSWCQRLCRDPLAPLNCEEARLGPAPDPDQRSQAPDCPPPAGLTVLRYLGSNDFAAKLYLLVEAHALPYVSSMRTMSSSPR